jgi:hypothetical protein
MIGLQTLSTRRLSSVSVGSSNDRTINDLPTGISTLEDEIRNAELAIDQRPTCAQDEDKSGEHCDHVGTVEAPRPEQIMTWTQSV